MGCTALGNTPKDQAHQGFQLAYLASHVHVWIRGCGRVGGAFNSTLEPAVGATHTPTHVT